MWYVANYIGVKHYDLESLSNDKISILVSFLCEKHFSVFSSIKTKHWTSTYSKLCPIPATNNTHPQVDDPEKKKLFIVTYRSTSHAFSREIESKQETICIARGFVIWSLGSFSFLATRCDFTQCLCLASRFLYGSASKFSVSSEILLSKKYCLTFVRLRKNNCKGGNTLDLGHFLRGIGFRRENTPMQRPDQISFFSSTER